MSDKLALPPLPKTRYTLAYTTPTGDERISTSDAWDDEALRDYATAALATQAEAHAAELEAWRDGVPDRIDAAVAPLVAERDALRAELTEAREQLSAHDAIRAQLESERDALRAELGAVNGN